MFAANTNEQVRVASAFVPKLVMVAASFLICISISPLVWLGSCIYHRPPNMVYYSQVWRYLQYTWTAQPSTPPGFQPFARLWLTLSILQHAFLAPVWGLAWLLDEFLYGRLLNDESIDCDGDGGNDEDCEDFSVSDAMRRPIFVIAGGRSGSTQLTRHLEDCDAGHNLVAPNILMCMFPFLWLWKLVPVTIGRFITPNRVRELIMNAMPPESVERHELDPFRADTLDAAFLSPHLLAISLYLGPDIGIQEFSFADYAPHNKQLFEVDFPAFVDRLGRKTLLLHKQQRRRQLVSSSSSTKPKTTTTSIPRASSTPRFFIKGHFLLAAPALARHYPDANFLTIVRDPISRLQSAINYLRCNPADPFLGPVPWEWLTRILTETESRYCDVEMKWFCQTVNTSRNRCVVRFEDFVKDLTGTMERLCKECGLAEGVQGQMVEAQHPPRDRQHYSVNRSLEDLDVNQDELKKRLADYIDWLALLSTSSKKAL